MLFFNRKRFEEAVERRLQEEYTMRHIYERLDALDKRCTDLEIRLCNLEYKVDPPKGFVTTKEE